MDKQLQEDTVSADRKERIIFDPDAWRKSDKSGKKTSAITSRQNFDNEKFTRKEQEKVDEGTIQTSGDSKIDTPTTTQSDTISNDGVKKSNSPQIEFVTGNAITASASTAIGGAQATGRKIAEALVKKAISQVKADKNVGTEEIPFDGPYTKTPADVVDKSSAHHTAYSRVRTLARQALKKQQGVKEEVESIEEKAPEGFEGTVKAMKKHKEIDNPFALANWMKKKGYKSHVKEESENVDEAYGRRDAYTRDYHSSISGFGKHSAAYHADGGANDEGWGNEHHKTRSTMDRPHTVHINGKPWKKFSNGHQAHAAARTLQAKGKDAHAVAHFNEEEETEMSKTYSEFMEQLLEYTPGPGGVTRVKGRSYGAQYHDPDGDDDADEKPAAKPADAPKRGRGRPKGAKSGANQKVTTGKSYGGIATHSLNLPNSSR